MTVFFDVDWMTPCIFYDLYNFNYTNQSMNQEDNISF